MRLMRSYGYCWVVYCMFHEEAVNYTYTRAAAKKIAEHDYDPIESCDVRVLNVYHFERALDDYLKPKTVTAESWM